MFATRGSPSSCLRGDATSKHIRAASPHSNRKPNYDRRTRRRRQLSGPAARALGRTGIIEHPGPWQHRQQGRQARPRRVNPNGACVTTSPSAGPPNPRSGPKTAPGPTAGRNQELLHHRPHRPRQVDAGGPDAAAHRRGRGPPDARAVPGPDGHRARARHHDQEPGGAPAVERPDGQPVRPEPHRHPRPRRLQLRGIPQPGRLRGRGAAGRRRPGHRGADAGQPVHGPGGRPQDHPGAEQDRPARGPARPVRRRTGRHHRLRPQRGAPGVAPRPARASRTCCTRSSAWSPPRTATRTPRPGR